ncbi:tetratricopeptide-like helical domain, Protein SirB1 [Artemisia annua]|uniref:Tetratricopeptide-like helical domain, Protein SirB1 n=2 Tax=Artemisia annua TaxID=35608 RepID=A0A2U1QLL4_ARTAN|nr:tetratricopeptide-like helical domain, Protein SirB1 [Artemisia annua]
MMLSASLPGPIFRFGVAGKVDKKFKNLMDFGTPAAVINQKKRRLSLSPLMATAAPVKTGGSSPLKFYQEVLTAARTNFTQEISFQAKDKDISLAKTLLHISAEYEAFIAFNREMDASSFQNERKGSIVSSDVQDSKQMDSMLMAGKRIEEWLSELDAIAKEVEVELVSRDIGCHYIEVLEAVNKVLFESRGFKRSAVVDSKCSYLHSVLSSRCGSAILLSIIYIEVCRRLNLTILGSRVGEDFLIWPQTGNPEELFKVSSGHSLFGIVNGRCVDNPKSKASDLNSHSLLGLDIASNRDIIGIYLANLIRLHWKRASRTNHGLMLTSPLRPVDDDTTDGSSIPLLRPQDLRLAIMASEKLLILQPHNWALRRDHGMMLYFSRDYGEAVQELSICMAFAPEEEAEILEPFVEKLHFMRLESSWKSLGHKGRLTVP